MALDIVVELKATIADFEAKMANVRKELTNTNSVGSSQIDNLASKAQSGLGNVSAAFAGTAGIAIGALSSIGGKITEFVGSSLGAYESLATQVRNYSQATGESTQQSSVAIAQANQFKIPIDALTRSMTFLGANVQLHPAYFQRWGVEIAKNKDGSTDMAGTLANLTTRYQDTADASVKDAMAKELLSRGYQKLLPLLNATPVELKAIAQAAADRGEILSPKDIDTAMGLQRALTELKTDAQAFGVIIAKDVAPTLLDLVSGIDRVLVDIDHFTSKIGGLGGVLRATMGIFTGGLSEALINFGKSHATAADAALKQAQAEQALQDALDQQDQAVTSLNKAMDDNINAQMASSSANRAVVDANKAVGDAQTALSDLLKKGAVDWKAVQTAQEGVQSADKGVVDAHRQVADAQDALNTLLRNGAVDAKAVQTAQDDLARATRSTSDATQRLADAQTNLTTVEKGATALDKEEAQLRVADATNTLARAQETLATQQSSGKATSLDLSDAQHAVEQAQIDLTRSQQTLNDTMTQGLPGSKDYKAAQDQVTSATQTLADAQKAQKDATEKLQTAEAGDPEFLKKVADARQTLADKVDNVTSATDRQRDAHQALATAEAGDPDFLHKVADAQQNVADKIDAVKDATWRQFTAAQNAYQAQLAMNDALDAGGGSAATLADQLNDIAKANPSVAPVVQSLLGLLGMEQTTAGIVGQANTSAYNNAVSMLANPQFLPITGAHAAGGDFAAGDTILVGEKGPEIARFGTGGTIINNATTGAIAQAANAVLGFATTDRVTATINAAIAGMGGGPAVAAAESWYGVPYLWGGGHGVSAADARKFGVDCSGLVDQVFGIQGTTYTQVGMGTGVPSLDTAMAGDLVFFGPQAPGEPHHVGIYKGGGIMIDAPHTGTVVRDDVVSGFGAIYAIRRLAQAAAAAGGGGGGGGGSPAANQELMQAMAAGRGWTGGEWSSLYNVEMREAGFNQFARNASSGAYGIPQALPESKLPFAGQAVGGSSPSAQIGWMLDYISGRYRDPIGAWNHEQSAGWYDAGGLLPPGLSLALNTTGHDEIHTAGGGGIVVNVYVAGSVVTEQQLVETVRTGLLQRKRALGTLGLS